MTQAIRFKDRKQTLSNEHGHYRFVSGDTILVMIMTLSNEHDHYRFVSGDTILAMITDLQGLVA